MATEDDLRADYEARLNAKSDEITALIRLHGETVGGLREQITASHARLAKREKLLDEERIAHDETKAELMDALLQIERLRGYLNALEDLRPPRMVEEAREIRGAERAQSYHRTDPYARARPRRFFERGS